ncbi:hypothetical protein DT019_30220 [Streptomyces sp. SDr-06]|uniref:hypothetical protein n=1 Tax=Streptomyces sp. SDr-06 TaxID=2267702 RepID=UPI000DE94C5A|nr:hypothetical protein [Streptomyces sp. SDr-06]RCH64878.1 hypothetical protein DT019_30220 [Streptomyces sp. SDr-06]
MPTPFVPHGRALTGAAAAGLLLALSASGSALAAPANATYSYTSSVDANSSLRIGPSTTLQRVGITTAKDPVQIDCYYHGTDVNSGGHHTDVWYRMSRVTDPRLGTRYDAWSWGGNVNTPHDPPAGMPECHYE